MSERTIHHEIRLTQFKNLTTRAKTSTRNSEISITDTTLKDAKRSDFVRNRDMEGDIDMDKVPLCP